MKQIHLETQEVGRELLDILGSTSQEQIEFVFTSQFSNSKLLRDAFMKILPEIGIQTIWKNRCILVVDELSNNAIEHGSGLGDIITVRLAYEKSDSSIFINIEVEDSGGGKHKKSASDMEQAQHQAQETGFQNHTSIRGRGLFLIISGIVDRLYFQDAKNGGLIVGIEKTLEL